MEEGVSNLQTSIQELHALAGLDESTIVYKSIRLTKTSIEEKVLQVTESLNKNGKIHLGYMLIKKN